MPDQLLLFEEAEVKKRPALPRIFVYENFNIHQKINFHSNDIYAPHFTCKYSYMMGPECWSISKWQTKTPGEGRPKYQRRYFRNLVRRAKRMAKEIANMPEEKEIDYAKLNIHEKINFKMENAS